ncbi:ArsR/SmtB family transcription factor [Brevibacterium casei]|uniref:Helix-turn-helix transcriptional regulator n=1 Tax=Brevibacterium casei TaxID=33889 RepID=A0A7T2TGW0_9MICO|nr:metalloregulator ArsR/SmtB family transcription factor [Brevibacterium casei]QPS33546.1 helix-turn-helix transcriptional regulator [Brevibacterium casei]
MITRTDDSPAHTEDLDSLVEVLKVLAHPMRLKILQWLRDPRGQFPVEQGIADPDEYGICVSQITDKADLAQSTISSFMRTLERENLVTSTRVGKWTHYKRNEKRIAEIREALSLAL